jgi:hypothetical protein
MAEWTLKDIILMVLGSGTFIGSLVVVFNAISARLDARKKRLEEAELRKISNAVEVKRLETETGERTAASLVTNLWKIIEDKNIEIEALKKENLTRPIIKQLYSKLRQIRNEIGRLGDGPITASIEALIDQTEELLP